MKKHSKILLSLLSIFLIISAIVYFQHNISVDVQSNNKINEITFTQKEVKLEKQYKEQVKFLASEPRNIMHEKHLRDVESFIIEKLKQQKQLISIQTYDKEQYKNIEAIINENGTKTIVIGAHYDTYQNSLGADDNASSVVILLELAKSLKENFKNKDIKLRLVFFINEEPPFFKNSNMGSTKYAFWLNTQKEKVIAMYALDMLGTFSEQEGTQHYPLIFRPFFPSKGNFVAFVGNKKSNALVKKSLQNFRKYSSISAQGLTAPTWISGIDFSDHLSFYYYDWPALMITDTAFHRNSNYHTEKDTYETLSYDKMVILTKSLEKMIIDSFK